MSYKYVYSVFLKCFIICFSTFSFSLLFTVFPEQRSPEESGTWARTAGNRCCGGGGTWGGAAVLSVGVGAGGGLGGPPPVGTACGGSATERRVFPWGEGLARGCPEKVSRGPAGKGSQHAGGRTQAWWEGDPNWWAGGGSAPGLSLLPWAERMHARLHMTCFKQIASNYKEHSI